MQMNFAGGGHEVELDPYNIDEAWGHTTIRKDDAGIITVTTCKASEAEANGGINVSNRNIKTAKIANLANAGRTKSTPAGATKTRTKRN